MRILVIGGGGREHALCRAIAASPLTTALYCAPGNHGIAAQAETVAIAADDIPALIAWARANAIDFVVPGPEAPLAAGIVDGMEAAAIACFGPSAAAARLESSKSFMKQVAAAAGIATARWRRFTDAAAARAHVEAAGTPIVIKADGLAAGKGVTVATDLAQARRAIDAALIHDAFGPAGRSLVIEEWLEGEEASFHALADGAHLLPLATAQDHKRAGEGDSGPNTGGMGCYSPTPALTEAAREQAIEAVLKPTLRHMAAQGAPFRGVLYAGLMVTPAGPRLLEFNVRFGDPECQAILARLVSDPLPALIASRDGELRPYRSALAQRSRPHGGDGRPRLSRPPCPGTAIAGLEAAEAIPGVTICHAATRRGPGGWQAAGGRVLSITALGADLAAARERAYRGGGPHPLAGRLLPPRHRLAGAGRGAAALGRSAAQVSDADWRKNSCNSAAERRSSMPPITSGRWRQPGAS